MNTFFRLRAFRQSLFSAMALQQQKSDECLVKPTFYSKRTPSAAVLRPVRDTMAEVFSASLVPLCRIPYRLNVTRQGRP